MSGSFYFKIILHTRPLSINWVSITIMLTFCSQIILQNSSRVNGNAPCVAMYSLGEENPCKKWFEALNFKYAINTFEYEKDRVPGSTIFTQLRENMYIKNKFSMNGKNPDMFCILDDNLTEWKSIPACSWRWCNPTPRHPLLAEVSLYYGHL